MSIRRRASGALAMAFVALLAVTATVPAYAVNLDSAVPAVQNAARAERAQSLKAVAGATITVQRDGYTSAAAPKPKPKAVVPSQTASTITGISRGWMRPELGPIRSPFGARPNAPVAGVSSFHKGADIAAVCGRPVYAAAAGTVVEAGYKGSYGNWILIDHGNGVQTGYAHSSALFVGIGQHVAAGSRIANVGSTGSSTGCHVHFETRIGGTPVNPVPFMSARGVRIG